MGTQDCSDEDGGGSGVEGLLGWGAVGVYFNLWKKYTAISSTISNLLFIGFQIAVELKSAVMDRVQANLDTQLCKTNDQIECDSWFLAGLSAGWRGFSLAHNLEEGDVVFHLVGFCRFKVYIVRANHLGEVDAALGLLHLDAEARSLDHEPTSQDTRLFTEGKKKRPHPCLQEFHFEQNFVKDNIYEDLSLHLEAGRNGQSVWSICMMLESSKSGCSMSNRGVGQKWDHSEEMPTFKRKMLELKEATERLNAEVEVEKNKAEIDA
ncbi:hypothetical protein LIER_28146 [Lithospermum erythrorhizon]|uniref:TF-B3 domain-containing protein n=1 Tax=Lithospermum erythrorhizon TaxID=34254 RepID=A0AAV3RIF6_LITER